MTNSSQPNHLASEIDIALSALAAQGKYGAMTALAQEHGVGRHVVHALRKRAVEAVHEALTPEGAQRKSVKFVPTNTEDLQRAVLTLRMVGRATIRSIVGMLPILFGTYWSYGKVQALLAQASTQARSQLNAVDLQGIEAIAIDEMFSQGHPVLAGIDLSTQYLFLTEITETRSAKTWEEKLSTARDLQQLTPSKVVKDAGAGLGAGVRAASPEREERDDLFHAVYLMGRTAQRLENTAYGAIARVEALVKKRSRAKSATERRELGQQVRHATVTMKRRIERYDQFERLRRQVRHTLELADRETGRLRTSEEVTVEVKRLAQEMSVLGGRKVEQLATYLRNRAAGLGVYLNDLSVRLKAVGDKLGGHQLVEAVLRVWLANVRVSHRGRPWTERARHQALQEAVRHLLKVVGHDPAKLQEVLGGVPPEVAERHRASSAIENLNSALRPHLVVQKHAGQDLLDLFRFYWNTRTRQWGRWKGTSAHELLTGEKVDDWLTLLGFPPSEGRERYAIAA